MDFLPGDEIIQDDEAVLKEMEEFGKICKNAGITPPPLPGFDNNADSMSFNDTPIVEGQNPTDFAQINGRVINAEIITEQPTPVVQEAHKPIEPVTYRMLENLQKVPGNLVIDNINFMGTQYDGYMDWNFAGILLNLSIISDRKVRVEFAQDIIYPNLYIMSIARSTKSRKTTGMKKHTKFHDKLGLVKKRMPESFSPQRFIEELSNDSHRYFFRDEVAGLFAAMNKKGGNMAELRDILMYLYECEDYTHSLRTSDKGDKRSEFNVVDTFLNCWFMTTPESLKNSASSLDLTSGLLYRTLIQFPSGEKPWMGFRERMEADIKGYENLLTRQKLLKDTIDMMPKIQLRLTKEALEFYSAWQERRENEIDAGDNPIENAIFGRLMISSIKIAMLLRMAEKDFQMSLKQNDMYKGEMMSYISKECLEDACGLIDNYFLPNAIRFGELIDQCKEMIIIDRVKAFIYKYGRVSLSNILQNVKYPSKIIKPALEHLKDSKEIRVILENDAGGSALTHEVYLKP